MSFPTKYDEIVERMTQVDPINYAKTRNFIDGDVSKLSPYISRGVVSTKQVMECVLDKGHSPSRIEKFLQELAWRDYWQQIWIEKGDEINEDIKHEQPQVDHHQMPISLVDANTGIAAVDHAIRDYYENGYLHNHMRMYIAMIACNIGRSHWKVPARWMYYHLIDGDWASNALSWQWVAGSNANKKYYANQGNINKYCYSRQRDTFLDVAYEAFDGLPIPDELTERTLPKLITNLPSATRRIHLDPSLPILVYNYYNMDPQWRKELNANRILLLEPSKFQAYPISSNALDFALQLAKNIEGIQVFTGEFEELKAELPTSDIYYKEHPLNGNYTGTEDARNWMFAVKGYYPGFFAFWKKCRKELKTQSLA